MELRKSGLRVLKIAKWLSYMPNFDALLLSTYLATIKLSVLRSRAFYSKQNLQLQQQSHRKIYPRRKRLKKCVVIPVILFLNVYLNAQFGIGICNLRECCESFGPFRGSKRDRR